MSGSNKGIGVEYNREAVGRLADSLTATFSAGAGSAEESGQTAVSQSSGTKTVLESIAPDLNTQINTSAAAAARAGTNANMAVNSNINNTQQNIQVNQTVKAQAQEVQGRITATMQAAVQEVNAVLNDLAQEDPAYKVLFMPQGNMSEGGLLIDAATGASSSLLLDLVIADTRGKMPDDKRSQMIAKVQDTLVARQPATDGQRFDGISTQSFTPLKPDKFDWKAMFAQGYDLDDFFAQANDPHKIPEYTALESEVVACDRKIGEEKLILTAEYNDKAVVERAENVNTEINGVVIPDNTQLYTVDDIQKAITSKFGSQPKEHTFDTPNNSLSLGIRA